jgi:undecaprenyl diphosphate synthase
MDIQKLPKHVAVVMDGNGRWASLQNMPRIAGHRAGTKALRSTILTSLDVGISVLTVFAFSSENWQRPKKEVSLLMDLFLTSLKNEVSKLHENGVQIRFIGDRSPFSANLREQMLNAERLTSENNRLTLVIAVNYGGRWDIVNAMQKLAVQIQTGELSVDDIDVNAISTKTSLNGLPEPDLFIRTGGEKRISNFLLWHLAYTELYFTDTLWPDFDRDCFYQALYSYANRQRRFGQTGEQVESKKRA